MKNYKFEIMNMSKTGYKNDRLSIRYDTQFWLERANGEIYSFTLPYPIYINYNYIFNSQFHTL